MNEINLYDDQKEISKLPSFKEVLREFTLPPEAILFGVCDDGLPYLFKVTDDFSPHVAIENGTPVLRTIQRYVNTRKNNRLIVDAVYVLGCSFSSEKYYYALVDWARHGHPDNQKVMLLVEGLEDVDMYNEDFQWLLENGAKNGVFIVASFQEKTEFLNSFNLLIEQDGDGYKAPEGQYGSVRFFAL